MCDSEHKSLEEDIFMVINKLLTHAGKNINQSNELLEHQHHGEWLDNGKKATTSGNYQAMAALETLERRKNSAR